MNVKVMKVQHFLAFVEFRLMTPLCFEFIALITNVLFQDFFIKVSLARIMWKFYDSSLRYSSSILFSSGTISDGTSTS